ncbi:MAG TPA: TIGR00282 family metallophosphoesterase [Chthonomonadaceae bacterium]|nr:TIGR00282 family metallophosphoesterase [Chthonomonadaceae bacterium]
MRILMVGDVVGKPGRQAAQEWIPQLRAEHGADFVILNGENAAGGIGITPEIASALFSQAAVDVITLGNHAWGKRDIFAMLDEEPRLLRPANYPDGAPGRGYGVFESPAGRIGVAALQGRTFMDPVDDPFRAADVILEALHAQTRTVWIDFHAEATSEKQAMGWYVDGRASAVVGTHTHVQTADERILPGGTAYLTDVGMTGPIDSVIGMKRELILARFTSLLPVRFEVAEGEAQLCGVLVDVDKNTGHATSIQRLQVPGYAGLRASQTGPASGPDENAIHSS